MKRAMLWVVALGILVVGVTAGADLWAAPEQNPARQTVPTRTPVPPPTEPPPPPKEKPKPDPTAIPATPTPLPEAAPAGGASEPLLPGAGGHGVRLQLGAVMVVVGLFALAVVRRRA